jgi:adenine/guanine phosphoribosyltransferase-like PRPP-binding protein
MSCPPFTEPTTNYWQEILPPEHVTSPPWQYGVPTALPDSRVLLLPVRPLNNTDNDAVASLLVNQASISVVAELGSFLADRVRHYNPEVIIGLPTLGLSLAPVVAQNLGLGKWCFFLRVHKGVLITDYTTEERYVPLWYSRKFWYDDQLSADVSSITSPGLGMKKVYLDPYQLPLVKGRRVVIVDDAVSSGSTIQATWDMLEKVGCEIQACGVVMKQGDKWKAVLGEERASKLVYVLESPLLRMVENGWDLRF